MSLSLQEALYWRGIDMLPIMDELVIEEVQAAHEQLATLLAGHMTDEAMTNDQLQQMITDVERKSAYAHTLKSQCRLWTKISRLSAAQKNLLSTLETNLELLEKVLQRILQQITQQYVAPSS